MDDTRVRRVVFHPSCPAPEDGVLAAIASADLVTLGTGSPYSSVLPNLLVDGLAEVLRATRARRVLGGKPHDRAGRDGRDWGRWTASCLLYTSPSPRDS